MSVIAALLGPSAVVGLVEGLGVVGVVGAVAVALVVAVTEAEQTERAITALIVSLLVVAGLLTLLTIWYWRHTSPRRLRRRLGAPRAADPGRVATLDDLDLDSAGAVASGSAAWSSGGEPADAPPPQLR